MRRWSWVVLLVLPRAAGDMTPADEIDDLSFRVRELCRDAKRADDASCSEARCRLAADMCAGFRPGESRTVKLWAKGHPRAPIQDPALFEAVRAPEAAARAPRSRSARRLGRRAPLRLWLKARDRAHAHGDPVEAWPDLSGRGHDARGARDAAADAWWRRLANGIAAVRFDGIDDALCAIERAKTPRGAGTRELSPRPPHPPPSFQVREREAAARRAAQRARRQPVRGRPAARAHAAGGRRDQLVARHVERQRGALRRHGLRRAQESERRRVVRDAAAARRDGRRARLPRARARPAPPPFR